MAHGRLSRRLIAAVAIAAQVAVFLLPAMPSAFASPCPVHAGLAQGDPHTGSEHGQPAPADPEQGPLHPTIFGFACCASHMAGVFGLAAADAPARIAGLPAVEIPDAHASAELSGADPPPRIHL
jgi:hypothetical protein